MVGLSLLAYVSEHLSQNIGDIDCDRVKTGIEGLGGNKGGVAQLISDGLATLFCNLSFPTKPGFGQERFDPAESPALHNRNFHNRTFPGQLLSSSIAIWACP